MVVCIGLHLLGVLGLYWEDAVNDPTVTPSEQMTFRSDGDKVRLCSM
jgi:hypothetical protein